MHATDLAWAAGVIDGEGCITIQREQRRGSYQYDPALIVEMVHRPTIERLRAIFNAGTVRPAVRRHRQAWRFVLRHRRGDTWLLKLLPYLCAKHAEAMLLVMFWHRPQTERDALYWRCRALKTRQYP